MCLWRCPKDDTEFEDFPAYKIHVDAQHPAAADRNQLLSEGVLATTRSFAKQPSRSCPFCDVGLDSVGKMHDHIGGHLEAVALLAIPPLDDPDMQPQSDAPSSVAAGKDADGSRKNDFDKTLPVTFPENKCSNEYYSAPQGISGANFARHLARLPEEAVDPFVWITNVIPSEAGDPAPDPSGQSSTSYNADNPDVKEDTSVLRTEIVMELDFFQQEQKHQRHRTITDWLSSIDYGTQQSEMISRRQEGTGVWFTNSPLFRDWLHGSNQTLYCPGEPGAGKTMIAAIAVDHLCENVQTQDIGVAYIYCCYKTQADQSAADLAAAILQQLVQGKASVAEPVANLYDRHAEKKTRPSLEEIQSALLVVVSNHTKVYLVVDALDEYLDHNGSGNQLLNMLRQLQATGPLHVMVTSRFDAEVAREFSLSPMLEIVSGSGVPRRWSSEGETLKVFVEPSLGDRFQEMLYAGLKNRISGRFEVKQDEDDSSKAAYFRLYQRNDKINISVSLNGYEECVRCLDVEGKSDEIQATESAHALAHLFRSGAMSNLAITLSDQGRLDEAASMQQEVQEKRRGILGEEHPNTITAIKGRLDEAALMRQEVLKKGQGILGEEYPDTLTSIANLASTYRNQGRWKEAEELEVQVIETRKRVLGEEHPYTLSSIANLGSIYRNQGLWKEAEKLEMQVIETRKRVLGEEHPSTLTSIANLASIYRNQGRWTEAEKLEIQVIETRKRVLGEEYPDTLTSVANLASIYRNQERWKEAEELEVQVTEIRKRVLGEEHPDTLRSVSNLVSVLQRQGKYEEAEQIQHTSTS